MKKIIYFVIAFALTFAISSCNKSEGCTDSAATNYDSSAEEDDASCTYVTDTTTITSTATTGTTVGGTTTDTTTTDSTTTTTGANTLVTGTTTLNLENISITSLSGTTTIQAKVVGSTTDGLSIIISGDMPTTKTTYPVNNPFSDTSTASLIVNEGGVDWAVELSIFQGQITIVNQMDVVIEPNSDGSYSISFVESKFVDNQLAPTLYKSFSGNFTVKEYKADYTLTTEGKTYKASGVTCSQTATGISLTASAINEDNKSGILSIYLPDGATSGTYTVGQGEALAWLSPADGVSYINAITYNSTGTTEIYNSSQSGSLTVVKTGDEYSFTFSGIPTSDGVSITDVVSGTATCLLK